MKNIYLVLAQYDHDVVAAVITNSKTKAWIKFEKYLVNTGLAEDLHEARRVAAEYYYLRAIGSTHIL